MKAKTILRQFLIWRVRHISHKQFIMILAVLIGLSVGFSAVIIKNSVHLIQNLLTNEISIEYQNYLYFVYPVIGIFIAVMFVNYIVKQSVGHGIPSVLYAISKNSGVIKSHNMFSSVVSSALTVGFGGSVGLEGPTVATGAAIGSNIGRLFHLNHKQIILLLGCASAGAMSAIFKAPIAAIIFALEVIMLDLTMASLVPLLLASASAALTSYFFLGQDVLYNVNVVAQFKMSDVPYYILLALLTGMVSVYFTRMYMKIGSVFSNIKKWQNKLLIGGSILGLLIFFFPSLYGEGYDDINSCLRGDHSYLFNSTFFYDFKDNIWVVLLLFLMVIIFKVVATSVTFGAGGIGGIFAPSLFLGVNTGLFFTKVLSLAGISISETNFALAGMAGLIAGVIHAPLTAIFLIAEITGGYELFMPLMLVSTISYATTKIFESNSVYTIQLAKRGELFTHDKDKAILSLMNIETLIEKNFRPVHIDGTLQDLVNEVSKSIRNVFPVIDDKNTFHGLVLLDDIRHIMFKPDMYHDTYIENLMFMPSNWVDRGESMEDVAHKFQESGKYVLPVLEDGKYIGFVSRANVFSKYRRMLKHFSDD